MVLGSLAEEFSIPRQLSALQIRLLPPPFMAPMIFHKDQFFPLLLMKRLKMAPLSRATLIKKAPAKHKES